MPSGGVEFAGPVDDNKMTVSSTGYTMPTRGDTEPTSSWSSESNFKFLRIGYPPSEHLSESHSYLFDGTIGGYIPSPSDENFDVLDLSTYDFYGFRLFGLDDEGIEKDAVFPSAFSGPWSDGRTSNSEGGGGGFLIPPSAIPIVRTNPGELITINFNYNGYLFEAYYQYFPNGDPLVFEDFYIGPMRIIGWSPEPSAGFWEDLKLKFSDGFTGTKSFSQPDFTYCTLIGATYALSGNFYALQGCVYNRTVTMNFNYDKSQLVSVTYDYSYDDPFFGQPDELDDLGTLYPLTWHTVETFGTPERGSVLFDKTFSSQAVGAGIGIIGEEKIWSTSVGDITSSDVINENYNGENLYPFIIEYLDDRNTSVDVLQNQTPATYLANMLEARKDLGWIGYDVELTMRDGFVVDIQKVNHISH